MVVFDPNPGSNFVASVKGGRERCKSAKKKIGVNLQPQTHSYNTYAGLCTRPAHALVDTGAQDAVVGLWHWQRWMICLAMCFGLAPRFIPMRHHCEAGGVGGGVRIIAFCYIPVGIAGVNRLIRWCVLDEDGDETRGTPPLFPSNCLKKWTQ